MKKHRNKIIAGVVVVVALAIAFLWGGNGPGLRGWNTYDSAESEGVKPYTSQSPVPIATAQPVNVTPEPSVIPDTEPAKPLEEKKVTALEKPAEEKSKATVSEIFELEKRKSQQEAEQAERDVYKEGNGIKTAQETGEDKYLTDIMPVSPEPQETDASDEKNICTLSVKCDTILKNIEWLKPEKLRFVPEDGVVFAESSVTFNEGESVFDLLVREMRNNKIHMEFENTSAYNSAYIKGINNLYEFDCGELSNWMFKVNGRFPNYGCSSCKLEPGDRVEWVYTCDLGADVGGFYAVDGE